MSFLWGKCNRPGWSVSAQLEACCSQPPAPSLCLMPGWHRHGSGHVAVILKDRYAFHSGIFMNQPQGLRGLTQACFICVDVPLLSDAGGVLSSATLANPPCPQETVGLGLPQLRPLRASPTLPAQQCHSGSWGHGLWEVGSVGLGAQAPVLPLQGCVLSLCAPRFPQYIH